MTNFLIESDGYKLTHDLPIPQRFIDDFNKTQDWAVFDNAPASQMMEIIYPHYVRALSFPSKQFGNILTQEALAEFNATTAMLEEFHKRSIQWERFANANAMIGRQVRKRSGKPFKCKERIVTVMRVIDHPFRPGQPALVFLEDDSFVSADQCKVVNNELQKHVR